jgi:hypothetical protein
MGTAPSAAVSSISSHSFFYAPLFYIHHTATDADCSDNDTVHDSRDNNNNTHDTSFTSAAAAADDDDADIEILNDHPSSTVTTHQYRVIDVSKRKRRKTMIPLVVVKGGEKDGIERQEVERKISEEQLYNKCMQQLEL